MWQIILVLMLILMGDYITIMGEDDNGNKYFVLYEKGKAYHYSKDKDGNITNADEYDGKNESLKKPYLI